MVLDGEDRGRELVEMARIPEREDSVQGEAAGDGDMEDLEDSEVMERVGVDTLPDWVYRFECCHWAETYFNEKERKNMHAHQK